MITFWYLNHRGEQSLRGIKDWKIVWEPNPPAEYYPSPGWFLTGWDVDIDAQRTFSLDRIIFDHKEPFVLASQS